MNGLLMIVGAVLASQLATDRGRAEVDSLVAQLRATRMEIGSAHLEWTKVTEENGFTAPGRVYRTVSRYTCDLADGDLVIDAREQNLHTGPDSAERVEATQVVSSWNGRLLVRRYGRGTRPTDYAVDVRPHFSLYHNLLGLVFRSEAGDAESIVPERLVPSAPGDASRVVTWSEFEGEPTLRVTYSTCEGSWVLHFAIERGGFLVAEDYYSGASHSVAVRTELSGALGVWFPRVIESKSFATDGTVSLLHRWEIDLARSTINVPVDDESQFTLSARAANP